MGLCAVLNGRTMPAFLPASPGPWKCAPTAGPVKSLYMMVHDSTFELVSKVASAIPEPGLEFGGTSLLPLSSAFNATVSALTSAKGANTMTAANKIVDATSRTLLMTVSPAESDTGQNRTPANKSNSAHASN